MEAEAVAALFDHARVLKGWSKRELARRSGINEVTLLRILGGQPCTVPQASRLSSALGLSDGRSGGAVGDGGDEA